MYVVDILWGAMRVDSPTGYPATSINGSATNSNQIQSLSAPPCIQSQGYEVPWMSWATSCYEGRQGQRIRQTVYRVQFLDNEEREDNSMGYEPLHSFRCHTCEASWGDGSLNSTVWIRWP